MDSSVVVIENTKGEIYEFSGIFSHQIKKARLHIKRSGGEWYIRVDKYLKGELIDSRKLKR